MPNTGQFYVVALEPAWGERSNGMRLQRVRVRCTSCGGIANLSGDILRERPEAQS